MRRSSALLVIRGFAVMMRQHDCQHNPTSVCPIQNYKHSSPYSHADCSVSHAYDNTAQHLGSEVVDVSLTIRFCARSLLYYVQHCTEPQRRRALRTPRCFAASRDIARLCRMFGSAAPTDDAKLEQLRSHTPIKKMPAVVLQCNPYLCGSNAKTPRLSCSTVAAH